MNRDELNRTGAIILDCALYVHKALGPGLLESAYRKAMQVVLQKRNERARVEVPIQYIFDGVDLGKIFVMDMLVNEAVIIELKSVQQILPMHEAQILTYLKLSKLHLGYLINFNVPLLKQGFHRYVREF